MRRQIIACTDLVAKGLGSANCEFTLPPQEQTGDMHRQAIALNLITNWLGSANCEFTFPPQEQTGDMRRQAIACINLMAPEMPGGLQDNMDQ